MNFAAEETGVVATCGGNIVCLIDITTGRILKRFKQDKDGGQVCTLVTTDTLEESHCDKKRKLRNTDKAQCIIVFSQNFFTMAWTTVKMESEARQWPSNILAVGGNFVNYFIKNN